MAGGRVRYLPFADPSFYPPIEHSAFLLAERGWQVLQLGTYADDGKSQFSVAHRRIRIKRLWRAQNGWLLKLQYLLYFFWALFWVWRWRPQWLYASDFLSCPIAWLIQRLVRVGVVYHEHDEPHTNRTPFIELALRYRNRLGRDADICVLPEHERLLRFVECTGRTRPTFRVWNCPRLDEIPPLYSELNRELVIYYHGSITSHRLPPHVVVAASRFKGAIRICIAGYEVQGSFGYVRKLVKLAADHGVEDLIEPLGLIPRRDLLQMAARKGHVGLSLMPKRAADINLQHMVGASNKAFDYMACGIPILVTDLPDWSATFVAPAYARACDPDDPNSIEAELRWYLEHPEERREMGRLCQEKIRNDWNYEKEFASVLTALENGGYEV
jgi:glycosyltransferase involved in cell wall biosynthesis